MSVHTAAAPVKNSPEQRASTGPVFSTREFLTSDGAVLACILGVLGIYYFVPGLLTAAIGGLLFFALTLYRPNVSLAVIPLAIPLFYRPRLIGSLIFSPAEFMIVISVAAWIVRDGWTLLTTRRLPDLRRILSQPAVILALALGLIGILWLLVPPGDLKRVALRELRWTIIEPLLFFFLMLRWLRAEADIWRMVAAWLAASALVGREGVEQFLFGQTWRMEGVGRVSSFYPSATSFGIYLGRALPIAVVLAIFLPREWLRWRVACLLLAVPIAGGVLFSFARGAWIGTFVALAVVALISRNKWLLGGLGISVLAGLALLPFVRVERITSMFDFSGADNTGLSRIRIWTSALSILRDHPLAGIGQDQLLYQDEKYGVPHIRFLTVSHPHNWLLDFWLRLGLPGLLWFIAALTYFFVQSHRLWQRHRSTAMGALALALLAAMVDFVVHGLMDMAYFTMDNALTFWLMLGLLSVLPRLISSPSDALTIQLSKQ